MVFIYRIKIVIIIIIIIIITIITIIIIIAIIIVIINNIDLARAKSEASIYILLIKATNFKLINLSHDKEILKSLLDFWSLPFTF